jgi:hypothetical protein
MRRPWNKTNSLRQALVTATMAAVATSVLATVALAEDNLSDSWTQREKPIYDYSFNLRPSMHSEKTYSIVDRDTGRVIGNALWDRTQRRFTLFDAKRKYAGFIQATVSEPQAPLIYKQYLAYDQNNNYQGVIIKSLGGMPIPPVKPPSVATRLGEPAPSSFGLELRGQWQFFRTGNVAIEDVPIPEPRVLPWYLEEILESNQ